MRGLLNLFFVSGICIFFGFIFNFLFFKELVLIFSIIVLIYSFYLIIYDKKSNSGPLFLFLITNFVFVFGRPIIWMIDKKGFDISIFEIRDDVYISNYAIDLYLKIISVVLFSFMLSFIFFSRGIKNNDFPSNDKYDINGNAWRYIFYVGVFSSIIQALMYLQFFMSGGSYYDIFSQGKNAITFPGLSLLSGFLFIGYVGLLVFSSVNERNAKKYMRLFVLLSLLQLIKGSRGEIFSQIIVAVWLYFFSLRKSPNVIYVVASLAGMVLVAELVSYYRVKDAGDFVDGKGILLALKWFIYTQGASGSIVSVAVDNFGKDFESFKFIISPLLNPFREIFDSNYGGQTAAYGESSGLLAHELSWRLSPEMYLAGHGVGSSYIAETYLAGGIAGVAFATCLLVWIVSNPRKIYNKSKPLFFVFTCALPYLLFVPRESLVLPVVPGIKAIIIYLVVKSIYARYSHSRSTNIQPSSSS